MKKLSVIPFTVNIFISSVGTIANTITVIYFIIKDKRSISNRLMIVLNLTDIVLCITSCIMSIVSLSTNKHSNSFNELHIFFEVNAVLSALLTFFVALFRCVLFANPFLRIRQCVVNVCCGLTVAITIAFQAVIAAQYPIYHSHIATTSLLVALSGLSIAICIATLIKLIEAQHCQRDNTDRRNAAITIIIMGILHLVITMPLIFVLVKLHQEIDGDRVFYVPIVTLNSVITPFVYMVRKHHLRQHIWKLCPCTMYRLRKINVMPLETRS